MIEFQHDMRILVYERIIGSLRQRRPPARYFRAI